MRFKLGGFYRHTAGREIAIIGVVRTTLYGWTYVAEQNDSVELMPVGVDSDDYAANWTEISEEEWMKNFC